MKHPADEELLEKLLGAPDGDELEPHLQACLECRERLADLRADLERLSSLDGETLADPAPPLRTRSRHSSRWLGLLKAAALLALVAAGGQTGMRWLEQSQVRVVPYVRPAPAAVVRGLAAVACPVGDMDVLLDTLRATR